MFLFHHDHICNSSTSLLHISYRKIFLSILFFAFLYPFSISLGGDGLSANYFFVLFPLWFVIKKGKLKNPGSDALILVGLFIFIFISSFLFSMFSSQFLARRIASFIIFMSVFSYAFIKIDSEMIASFKIAVILISLYFSTVKIISYLSLGEIAHTFAAKGAVGGQRFGFIFILAIWLLLFHNRRGVLSLVVNYGIVFIIFVGLLLTFSRSSVVAILGSLIMFMFVMAFRFFAHPKKSMFKTGFGVTAMLCILIFLAFQYFPFLFTFFKVRLFNFFLEGDVGMYFANPESSVGYRVFMAQKILHFLSQSPLLGSGYLGVWTLFPEHSGSAHNQYLDVLFRTGIIGFIGYLYLIFRLLIYLYRKESGLFWGIIGVLIYGLFHETFKLSQGAFILAFLVGLIWQPEHVEPLGKLDRLLSENVVPIC